MSTGAKIRKTFPFVAWVVMIRPFVVHHPLHAAHYPMVGVHPKGVDHPYIGGRYTSKAKATSYALNIPPHHEHPPQQYLPGYPPVLFTTPTPR
eukprot:768677-Hanusia_phi.AAC.4